MITPYKIKALYIPIVSLRGDVYISRISFFKICEVEFKVDRKMHGEIGRMSSRFRSDMIGITTTLRNLYGNEQHDYTT